MPKATSFVNPMGMNKKSAHFLGMPKDYEGWYPRTPLPLTGGKHTGLEDFSINQNRLMPQYWKGGKPAEPPSPPINFETTGLPFSGETEGGFSILDQLGWGEKYSRRTDEKTKPLGIDVLTNKDFKLENYMDPNSEFYTMPGTNWQLPMGYSLATGNPWWWYNWMEQQGAEE